MCEPLWHGAMPLGKEGSGMDEGQDRGEKGKAQQVKQTEVSQQELKEKWIHIKRTPAPWFGVCRQETDEVWGLRARFACASSQFFQCLNHF